VAQLSRDKTSLSARKTPDALMSVHAADIVAEWKEKAPLFARYGHDINLSNEIQVA